MKFLLSEFIASDLEEIASYIAKDSPRYALATLQAIRREFRVLAAAPYHYRIRPEIRPELREAVVSSYVILFRVVEGRVLIERVLHGMRDLPKLLP